MMTHDSTFPWWLAAFAAAGIAGVLVASSPGPARAGGYEAGKGQEDAEKTNDENAGADARKGFEAYHKRDYRKARELLDKAVVAGDAEADTARSFLARIAFFYAEDDVAREHLSKIANKTKYDQELEVALDGPYKKLYGPTAFLAQGKTPKGYYHLTTDIGYDPKQADELRSQIAQLEAAVAKGNKKAEKQLKALKETRSEGWKEVARFCDQIFDEYAKVFKFPKDDKLVSRVIVLRERGDYLDFGQALGNDKEWLEKTGGYYTPFIRLLTVSAGERGKKWKYMWQAGRETLFHEAFHQYLDYYVERAPQWFNEGLASYFEEFDEDAQTTRLRLPPVEKEGKLAMGMTEYQIIIGALKPTAKDPLIPLKDFTAGIHPDFYEKEKMYVRYAQAWAVIRFLVEAHPKGKKILVEYFKALKDGKNPAEAQEIAFKGEDFAKLEKMFRAYFERM